jgi:hypothetical protein
MDFGQSQESVRVGVLVAIVGIVRRMPFNCGGRASASGC